MGNPRVASIRSVLDDEEAASRTQHLQHAPEDRPFVADKVKRVGHHHAIQVTEFQWTGEVGDNNVQPGGGKPPPHRLAQATQGARIAIDRRDVCRGAGEVRQRESEGPFAGAEVRPGPAPRRDPVTKEAD